MKPIKIIIISILFLSLSINVYSLYVFNQSCKLFYNQCDGGNSVSTQQVNIDQLIIEAGGHFLHSNSDFQLVLKKIELSETGLVDSIDQTIRSISAANEIYFEIWEKSKSLEYNPIVIEKLSQFDYKRYLEQNNLNPSIYQTKHMNNVDEKIHVDKFKSISINLNKITLR